MIALRVCGLALVIASIGCIKTAAVDCGNGGLCAPDKVCDNVHETCVFPDQLTSCVGLADGTACMIRGAPGGVCKDEVCTTATCGDEIVFGDEVCDGTSDIPAAGTCVDFSYDYGSLSCSALCTEGFDSCRRLGWQLRTLNGAGRIGGIWEDGNDLWLANQQGIYRRHEGAWEPIMQPAGTPVWYHAIWASGGHAFAVGNDGSIAHWDGLTWQNQSTGNGSQLFGIWGRAPNDVFAVGGKGTSGAIWHYDGATWTAMTHPSVPVLRAVGGNATAVFAVGDAGTILSMNGNTWTDFGDSTFEHDFRGVWATVNQVFAVGNPSQDTGTPYATIVHRQFTSLGWDVMKVPPNTHELNAISGRSDREVYAVGARDGSNILYYDGAAWSPMVTTVEDPVLGLNAVHAGASGVYAAKRPSVFLEYAGAGWVETAMTSPASARGIWATGPDYAIAVGDGLFFNEYVGGSWGPVPYHPCWGTMVTFVHDVWGTGPRGDVWIVGPYGKMMRRVGGSGLQCYEIPNGKWIFDVWGTGATDVFAVGADGNGTEPNLLHFNGTSWSDWSEQVRMHVTTLAGVWGFSSTDVLVTGGNKVLRYNGSTWSDAGLVTTRKLNAIWGSSPSDVFAAGEGGVIFHFDGTAWTEMFVPRGLTTPTDEAWVDVHGTGPNDVYVAGSRTLMRYDGTAWAPISRLAPTAVQALWATSGTVFSGGEGGVDARLIGKLQ